MKIKLIKTSIVTVSLILLFNSCASNKQNTVQADVFSDDEDITAISVPEEKNDQTEDKSRYKTSAEQKTFFEKMFTFGNKNDFVTSDTTSVFTKGVGSGIHQQKATIMINPDKGTAGFGSIYLAAYYILQYNPENYYKLTAAYQKYLDDFENKKLDRTAKKTYKQYGTMKVHLDWGTIKTSTPNNADGTAYIGYEFIKKSPYFTITIQPLENNYYKVVGDTVSRASLSLTYAFTKAQMKELLDFTSEEAVNTFMSSFIIENVEPEEYSDESADSEDNYNAE